MRWIFYHFASAPGHCNKPFSLSWHFLAIPVPALVTVTGLESTTLGLWVECCTTVLQLLTDVIKLFSLWTFPRFSCASNGGGNWAWIHDSLIMRRMLYYCATTADQCYKTFLLSWHFLAIPVLAMVAATGLEPMTLELWDELSTTVLLLLAIVAKLFFSLDISSLFLCWQWWQQLDLNPQPCDYEANVLPLCTCFCTML